MIRTVNDSPVAKNCSEKLQPRQSVLIVDDMPANIKVLGEVLKSDYDICVATSGLEGIEIAKSDSPPDLILLDIMMPEMDGYEVCQRLKADEKTKHIPIIFVTARTTEEDETMGLSLGAADYITKPFQPAIVKARIRTHLEIKRHRDKLENIVKERTSELMALNSQLLNDISERKRAEEQLRQARAEESRLLEITTVLSSELNLGRLLSKIMDTTRELLNADRCTLFMHDEKTDELWSQIAGGMSNKEIRIPSHIGIAGTVFTTGQTINIPDAYSDARFNPEVDKKTGYRTRSILCMPVKNKNGRIIGVTQVLNKNDGPFTDIDEKRLAAFSAQASIALENARLFEDILNMKNYNESLIESMSSGIISMDAEKKIVKCNAAAVRILHETVEHLTGRYAAEVFVTHNSWVVDAIDKVMETRVVDLTMDTDLILSDDTTVSVNVTVVPLLNVQKEFIGSLLILEDITMEKRLKGTISRYMTKAVAQKLLEDGESALGGQLQVATVLFSDIRSFTTIAERIGPQETVSMLNDYFSIMVDIIFRYEGILDKYIGDALLAVFGAPFSTGEDPDRSVRTAIDMLLALKEFNAKRKTEGKESLQVGIGISTNEVLSGNIGSLKRMEYTVIGDGVNLASRLEGANKIYGTNILVSEFTYKELKGDYLCREIDLIRVKGKVRPVAIYQVLGYPGTSLFPHHPELLEIFQEGLSQYRRRDWKTAIKFFKQSIQAYPNDTVARIYIERCRHYLNNPPPETWDRVWVMDTK